jgi:type I restriction enzyme S subunit
MKKYPKYKNSGIAWLGEIPENWNVEAFKNILTERNEKNAPIKSTERLSLSIDKGVTLYAEKTTNLDRFKDDFTQYKLAHKDDLVFNSMNMIVGAVGVSKYFGCVSPVYYTYHGGRNNNSTKFYEYLFRSKIVKGFLFSLGRGLIAKDRGDGKYNTLRLKVSRGDLRAMRLPFPPLSEQTAIANFLDHKLEKIERFISKKKALIELLNEQKAAIINQAVTKGLTADCKGLNDEHDFEKSGIKMKPSGIEWLGDIPEHWEVRKLKFDGKIKSGDGITSNSISKKGEYEVFGGNGFIGYTDNFNTDGHKIIIGRVGAKCGNIHYITDKKFISDNALILSLNPNSNFNYISLVLQVADLNKLNTSSAQPLITGVKVMNYPLPIAPVQEQKAIVSYIETETAKIAKTIATIEKEISLVEEYKTALIAEAVTGKIDVRKWSEPLIEDD